VNQRADDDGMAERNEQPERRERIAKAIARAGLASRREAEGWISAGRVTVNGAVIDSPALAVTAQDSIAVDGKPLPARERTRLLLFHKPRGFLTTQADPQRRPTIFAILPKGLPRLISVGRLDLNTEGLLLLTNDGALARMLELPATGWLRRYRVRAHGRITQNELDRLREGITINRVRYGPIEASIDRGQGSNTWLTFAIREGKNREVKNVLGHLGLAVNRLIRISFGPFQLGELAPGAIEEVRTRTLRDQLGARIAASIGADFSGPQRVKDQMPDVGRQMSDVRGLRFPKGKRGPLPPPLWGRAGEGGGASATRRSHPGTPTPNPSPQGGGEHIGGVRRQASKKRGNSFGPIGEPERARQEKRRGRRAGRRKRR
jgi:23S rRNA pseudouridine2605 synthase